MAAPEETGAAPGMSGAGARTVCACAPAALQTVHAANRYFVPTVPAILETLRAHRARDAIFFARLANV